MKCAPVVLYAPEWCADLWILSYLVIRLDFFLSGTIFCKYLVWDSIPDKDDRSPPYAHLAQMSKGWTAVILVRD